MITSSLLPAPHRRPVTPEVRACRDALARRLAAQVRSDGLVHAPCESRALESALLLRLVNAHTPHAEARDRLVRHLKTSLDDGRLDPIQTAVARAALGEAVCGDEHTERALNSFDHFTAPRKRLMFQTLLAELDAAEFPTVPLEVFDHRGQQSWLHLEMTALKVLTAHGTGRAHQLTTDDWHTLQPALRTGDPWEGNHLARLIGLLALVRSPHWRTSARHTVDAVGRTLRPDGGIGFVTGMDLFATATAGLALVGAGAPRSLLQVMADAFAAHQNPDGGFGYTTGVRQSDTDDTAYGVEFLRAVDRRRHHRTITAAQHHLLGLRNADGGFPTFARGTHSEVAMTAGAVNALSGDPDHQTATEAALRFLTTRPHPHGIVERSWSRNFSNALFRAVLACDTVRPDTPPALRGAAWITRAQALAHLCAAQNPDGGWGHQPGDASDPISTGYATVALSRDPAAQPRVDRALDYLTARQRPDGGYHSRPDQAGPRPLLYDVPVLADVFVLLGLAHAVGAA